MTTDWIDKFLACLRKKGNVSLATKAAKIGRQTVYDRRKADALFAQAWDEALEEAGDWLEEEARRRAQDGTLKPVFYQGTKVASIREYSDTLLIFLLKGIKPDKYRERRELTGKDGAPIELNVYAHLADAELDARIAALERGEAASPGTPDAGAEAEEGAG